MKKILSIGLSFILLLFAAVPALAANELSEWAKAEVESAESTGIVTGLDIQSYQSPITREQFCVLVFNMIQAASDMSSLVEPIEPIAESPFTDVDNGCVNALFAKGIINGKSESKFAPNDFLTREEAATILTRTAYTVISQIPFTLPEPTYQDNADISEWAREGVKTVSGVGVMKGVGDNCFAPKMTYTVEQAICTVYRAYSLYVTFGPLLELL